MFDFTTKTSPMDKDSVNIDSTMHIADEESGNKKTVESEGNDQGNPLYKLMIQKT